MFRFYDEQEQSTFQAFQPVFTHMNTVFVAENILFKEDYWCRNCPLSTFVALGATETLGRLENSQSQWMFCWFWSVCGFSWQEQMYIEYFMLSHAFESIAHIKIWLKLQSSKGTWAYIIRSPDRWNHFCSVCAAAVLKGQQFNSWA